MKRVALIFLLTLLAYVLTASGHLYSPDEELVFRTTRALARGEGLAITPLGDGFASRPANPPRADGREYAQYGIGQPLLAVPLYWLGSALGHIGDSSDWMRIYGRPPYPLEAYGFTASPAELAPRFVCSWFNVLVGALLAVLVFLLCLEVTQHRRAATWAAMLYALGSLAWPHSRPFFTESLATLMIVLSWWALLRARRGALVGWCLLAGAAAGYAFWVRMDSMFAYPGLALLLLGPIVQAARQRGILFLVPWVAFALPALCCGLTVLVLNKLHFGNFLATGYADQTEGVSFSSPLLAGLYGLLCSPGKGLFFFSPALVLSFLGWRPLAERLGAQRGWLLGAFGAAILVPLCLHAMWINWAGGWCWGPRHIFMIHAFFAVPIAAWCAAARPSVRRVICSVALVVGAGVQLLGSSQDFIYFHNAFFRAPGQREMFFVTYDSADRAFWDQYYQLNFRFDPTQPVRAVPLYPPAPIQDSIYIPQRSVWTGYPRMWRWGVHDNYWLHLLAGAEKP